ncbi:MAG: hypothetical protein JXA14_03015 [Anaerolineae bacterium]|jgi:hypothetical protein|nr:hypothetical protein [Anaerolineae bacterium]
MSEEKPTNDTWYQVGQQFQTLGESLAEAFRAAWEDEGNRQHMQGMQAGLEKMVHEVGQAIKEAGESPEGQRARAEAKKAAESAKVAGTKAWRDARPHVLSALRSLDTELQKVISQMEATEEE